jgi:tetratricopeptide (TPR) repeat protein
LFVIIAWGAGQISSKVISFKKPFIFASIFIIVLFTVAAHNQIKIWTNTVTLFEDALKKDPNNHLAYHIIGQEMAKNGENEKALYYFDMAIKIRPGFYPTYSDKGIVLMRMGKRDEAFKNFEKAIQVNKVFIEPYYNLGIFYLEDNNLDKSIAYFIKVILQFEKALHINPYNKNAQRNLQFALEKMKKSKNTVITP